MSHSHLDLISDHSKEKLVVVPAAVLDMTSLKMLFLEGNFITTLPDDIFWKLPRLMWLDLRNNLLELIPTSIAFHEKLENLLLTNNNIQKLPNELGTVHNLKALQVSDNPLIYPTRPVIVAGTKAIKSFLKAQFEKENAKKAESEEEEEYASDRATELGSSLTDEDVQEKERVLQVTNKISEEPVNKSIEVFARDSRKNISSAINKKLRKKLSDDRISNPDLCVKQLLSPDLHRHRKESENSKIIHKVSKNGSKLYLKSYFNRSLHDGDNKTYHNLKEGWLNELRILLTDQERILQQERNLKAISNWRLKKKSENPKIYNEHPSQPPYDVDERYLKMLSREDLAKQIDEFKEKVYVKTDKPQHTSVNIQKMIDNLMAQLKDMDISYDPLVPGQQTELAEIQIRTIMDIQKKLMKLKSINEKIL